VFENFPHLAHYIEDFRTEEEILAVQWCCEHYVPLKHTKGGSWVEVFYEQLILSGPDELKRIYFLLGLSDPEKAIGRLKLKSMTTRSWSADHNRVSAEERLGNWKHKLDKRQVSRILSVVEAFDISGFSDDVIPDFDNIRASN
jgi:hypothetical protein